MTVSSGRASSGARSVLRAAYCGVLAIVGLIAGGCGNNTLNYGTVVITVSSDPGPFNAYVADVAAITLVRSDGSGYGLSYSSGFGKTVDFTRLADTTEVLGAPAIVENTYTSATITLHFGSYANYLAAQIYVNGQTTAATLLDSTGATPGSISYSVKFDPAHPLVVKKGTPTTLDLHFDMNASTIVDASVSPVKATVRPFLTASTQPVQTKTLRTRGEFVTTDIGGSNFTVNTVSFFDSPLVANVPMGAVQIQTTAQTTYNVNGTVYQGPDGLAAMSGLSINTVIASYGTFTDLTPQKPVFTATEVYAGVATENVLAARVTGTIASRTGNTLHIHNADVIATSNITNVVYGVVSNSGVLVRFLNDIAVTVDANTTFTVDGQPTVASNLQLPSVGQRVELEGVISVDSAGTSSVDASGGLVRLTSTTAWGDLKSATAGSATVNLLTLGGVDPATPLIFTGTGAATGADVDPTNYQIDTGTVDLTGQTGTTVLPWRFDGRVVPFGSASPGSPDFTATAVTAGSATDQVLEIEWTSSGTTAPFLTSTTSGLAVNIANASLGNTHVIRTGPTSVDLKGLGVSPTIVPDLTLTASGKVNAQFSIGNPASTTGISVFHTFDAYVAQINTVLNGTNTVLKLVAVGHASSDNQTFTATRIDIVQLP
jgi:hypothetical protein